MATKDKKRNRKVSLKKYYMEPSLNSPYTYLESLFDETDPVAITYGERAQAMLEQICSNFQFTKNNNGVYAQQSLDFLLQVIESQRISEINFLKTQIQLLNNTSEKGQIQQDLIKTLESFENGQTGDGYLNFIKTINEALNTIKGFKARFDALTVNANMPNNKNSNIMLRRRLMEQCDTLINNITGSRTQFHYSYEEAVRQATLYFLKTKGYDFMERSVANAVSGGGDIAAAAILIQQELAVYLSDRILPKLELKYEELRGISEENKIKFERIYTLMKEAIDTEPTFDDLANIFNDQTLLEDTKKLFGISIKNTEIRKRKGGKANTIANAIMTNDKFKTKIDAKSKITKALRHVKVDFQGKGKGASSRHVSFADEIRSLLNPLLLGRHLHGSGATDVLLGQFITSINGIDDELQLEPQNSDNNLVIQTLNNIKQEVSNSSITQDPKKLTQIYQKNLEELENKLNNLQKAFIIHESVKFYTTLEDGTRLKALHGRQMLISNYINSIDNFGVGANLDTKWLSFAIYNLATDALGAYLKDPLQTYLAIFAGIIMFDDFGVIAKQATSTIQLNNVTNLHLYHINDIYVPASLFLQAVYEKMDQVQDSILSESAFSTIITGIPTINYKNNPLAYGPNLISRWGPVKEKSNSINIELEFAAHFLSLLSNIT